MEVYIKSRADFATVRRADAESYSVPIATVTDETGKVRIPDDERDYTADWLYLDGSLFLITQYAPKDGMVDLTVADPATAFSRPLVWPETAPESYGAFIADALEREYINCADAAYRIPYMTVANTDDTPLVAPELDDTRLYTLLDIIAAARQAGVLIAFAIHNNALAVSISTAAGSTHNILFSDGHAQLESETYSREVTAKVTVLQEVEPEEGEEKPEAAVYSDTTWYLAADGAVSQEVPENRATGEWTYITCKADEDPEQKAREVFAGNIASHKIEFYSDRQYGLWDSVNLRLSGAVFSSRIVSTVRSSSDSRYLYRCGELATTLTEKVRKAGTATTRIVQQNTTGGGALTCATAFATNATVANGARFCELTLEAGSYLVGGYFLSNTDTLPAWLNGVTDANAQLYTVIEPRGGFTKTVTLSQTTNMYYQNLSGSGYQVYGSTCLWALKLA